MDVMTIGPQGIAQRCRVCGCTDDHACPEGCWWVEPDLCSSCQGAEDAQVRLLPIPTGDLVLRPGTSKELRLRPVGSSAFRSLPGMAQAGAWKGGGLAVMVTLDPTHHGPLLHCSISHKHRYPDWDEILAVRYLVFPADVDVVMVMPRSEDYVAVHPNCFHVWQAPTPWRLQ